MIVSRTKTGALAGRPIALAALATALAALALLAGCQGKAPEESGPAVKVVAAELSESASAVAKSIAGVEGTSLSEAEVARLASYLEGELEEAGETAAHEYSVKETTKQGGPRTFEVKDHSAHKSYELEAGDAWSISEVVGLTSSEAEKFASLDLSGQQASELDSKESAHAFDTSKSWPLSYRDKVEPAIGKEVADRLLADVNAYLDGRAAISDEINLSVAVGDVAKEGSRVVFTVLAHSGIDNIVLKCDYAADGGDHEITWQP